MKTFKLFMAIMIALVCFTSCGSDDDKGIEYPTDITKRIKSVRFSNGSYADFTYNGDNVSRIAIKEDGETLTMEYSYQSDNITEKVTNDFYNANESYTNTITLKNGLASRFKDKELGYSAGYMIKEGDGYNYTYDNKGNMTASPYYDKIEPSDIENRAQIYQMDLYGGDMRDLRFYLGAFGNATKYLPKNASYSESGDKYTATYSYKLDKDGYVSEIVVKWSDGDSWTEYYTYETI